MRFNFLPFILVALAYADPHLLRGPHTAVSHSRATVYKSSWWPFKRHDKQWWWPSSDTDNDALNPYSGFPT